MPPATRRGPASTGDIDAVREVVAEKKPSTIQPGDIVLWTGSSPYPTRAILGVVLSVNEDGIDVYWDDQNGGTAHDESKHLDDADMKVIVRGELFVHVRGTGFVNLFSMAKDIAKTGVYNEAGPTMVYR